MDLLQNIEIQSDNLPEPKTLSDKDYWAIINKLKRLLSDSITIRSSRQKESIEYYTTWIHQIKTPISVMQMILQGEDTAEHLELSNQLFRIELSYEPLPKTDNVTVVTDEKWLLFILEQLLSNAVKYTEKGGIAISVTRDKKLIIADTGIGIAEEDLPRIFEKGFTGYNGRSDKKSTGLGLYLCKLTADKLSHKIEVSSEIGKGTVFSIDLNRYRIQNE